MIYSFITLPCHHVRVWLPWWFLPRQKLRFQDALLTERIAVHPFSGFAKTPTSYTSLTNVSSARWISSLSTSTSSIRLFLLEVAMLSVRKLPVDSNHLRGEQTGGIHYLTFFCLSFVCEIQSIKLQGKHRLIKSNHSPWWLHIPFGVPLGLLIRVLEGTIVLFVKGISKQ